jgi:hypothetical protein
VGYQLLICIIARSLALLLGCIDNTVCGLKLLLHAASRKLLLCFFDRQSRVLFSSLSAVHALRVSVYLSVFCVCGVRVCACVRACVCVSVDSSFENGRGRRREQHLCIRREHAVCVCRVCVCVCVCV